MKSFFRKLNDLVQKSLLLIMFIIWKYLTPITIRKPYYMFISGKINATFAT